MSPTSGATDSVHRSCIPPDLRFLIDPPGSFERVSRSNPALTGRSGPVASRRAHFPWGPGQQVAPALLFPAVVTQPSSIPAAQKKDLRHAQECSSLIVYTGK